MFSEDFLIICHFSISQTGIFTDKYTFSTMFHIAGDYPNIYNQ